MHMSVALLGVLACRRGPARHTLQHLNSLCSRSAAAALIRSAVQIKGSLNVDHAECSTSWEAVDSTRHFGSHHQGRSWQSSYSSFGAHNASWASKGLWGQQHPNHYNLYHTSTSSSSAAGPHDNHSNRNSSSSSSSSTTIPGAASGSSSRTWQPTSKALHPAQLTACIKRTTTPQQLQQLVQQHGAAMNHIHIAAAMTLLGQWKTRCGSHDQSAVFQLLGQLEQLLQPQILQQCACRGLSNMLWAICALRYTHTALYSSCLKEFMSELPTVKSPQDVSNVLYGVAECGKQLNPAQVQQLLAALVRPDMLHLARPQELANTLWAVAKMGQQVPEQQLQQLLTGLVSRLSAATPQNVSNTLWAVVKMEQQVPEQQLLQLLAVFVSKLSAATPQNVSNTLWAVAKMEQQVPEQQLLQLLAAFVSKLSAAAPQNVSNTLWAFAAFSYLPGDLLAALATQPYLDALIETGEQELANTALACAHLGHRDDVLMGALLQRAGQLLGQQGSSIMQEKFTVQGLCNICWSVAVLDLQQHAAQLPGWVRTACQQWGDIKGQELQQLYHVHTWLLDFQLAGGQGLAGTLTEQQLEQCRAAVAAQHAVRAAEPPSQLQRDVFAAWNQLPLSWQQQPAMEQLSQPDGALLIDITGVTADGMLLAIEVDGPTHFRRPDRQLTGPTQYRNRALAARGYTLISVPYFEWDKQQSAQQRQQYLMQLVEQHCKGQQQQQGQPQQLHTQGRLLKHIAGSSHASAQEQQKKQQR